MADQRALDEREARKRDQERFLAAYDEVKADLIHIPGIVNIGMGLRERGGALANEPAFRVYVEEKLPLADVPPLNRDPVGNPRLSDRCHHHPAAGAQARLQRRE